MSTSLKITEGGKVITENFIHTRFIKGVDDIIKNNIKNE